MTAAVLPLARTGTPAASAPPVDVGALFVEHAPFLLRVVERLSGSGAHVDDIVQDVFVVAHRRRAELREGHELRGWLYRVASHRAQRHRRSMWRWLRLADAVRTIPAGTSDRTAPSALDVTAQREDGRLIRAVVLSLPYLLREVFVLRDLEGLTTKEIARLLDVPEGTVWSRASAARAAFRAAWSEGRIHEPTR